jgi:hypothetical protein
MGYMRNAYRILEGNPEGNIPFGRPSRKCEYNIKEFHKIRVIVFLPERL